MPVEQGKGGDLVLGFDFLIDDCCFDDVVSIDYEEVA